MRRISVSVDGAVACLVDACQSFCAWSEGSEGRRFLMEQAPGERGRCSNSDSVLGNRGCRAAGSQLVLRGAAGCRESFIVAVRV